ncbi:hypothetical protein CONLIGDRAFT_280096 [Coniochaeta ligniaria NRRL 30616]|uniref:Uncharacterized protein n=1 Tax=Coniochaeta ligniaria NRRL 30616 TaxID=1408157 RepID=A0A1J7IT15_9PEZI|nr:hypothetical protein CONLIGDRAFT_280096 [Coniochaeta ligniaria NRRL 30616]
MVLLWSCSCASNTSKHDMGSARLVGCVLRCPATSEPQDRFRWFLWMAGSSEHDMQHGSSITINPLYYRLPPLSTGGGVGRGTTDVMKNNSWGVEDSQVVNASTATTWASRNQAAKLRLDTQQCSLNFHWLPDADVSPSLAIHWWPPCNYRPRTAGYHFRSTSPLWQLRILNLDWCSRDSSLRVLPLCSSHQSSCLSLIHPQATFGTGGFPTTHIHNPGPNSRHLPSTRRTLTCPVALLPLYHHFLHFFPPFSTSVSADSSTLHNEDNAKIKVLPSFFSSISPEAWARRDHGFSHRPRHFAYPPHLDKQCGINTQPYQNHAFLLL